MDHNYIIRRANISDLDYIYKVICELENEKFDSGSFRSIYEKNIANPENVYLVLFKDKESIGYISLHIQSLLHHCGLIGEIQEFFIDKEYRNKGLGKMLINGIEKEAKSRKLKAIEVTSNKKRMENVNIYQSLGYSLTHNKFTKDL